MTTQSSLVTSKPLACISTFWPRCLLTLLLAAFGTLMFPANGRADMSFVLDNCTSADGCNQSINFTPASTGTTVTGDTNPPQPLYDVTASSGSSLVLHASGSTVDTGSGGPGFTLLILTPQTGFMWSRIEFQLDSMDATQPLGSTGLVLTATDQWGNVIPSDSLAFPHEGNNGENQHYLVIATNGEFIKELRISYTDPFPLTGDPNHLINTINDIHNIDVGTVITGIPEPSSFLLVGLSLLVGGPFLRRYL